MGLQCKVLPVGPGLEAVGVHLLDDRVALVAEEDSQWWVVNVGELQDRLAGGRRVSEVECLRVRREGLAQTVVPRIGLSVVGARVAVGGVAAGLDQGHLDAEAGDLLGEGFAQAFEGPLEAQYAAPSGNPETPATEEIWMMCPPPCSRRWGTAAWTTHTAPKKLVSN